MHKNFRLKIKSLIVVIRVKDNNMYFYSIEMVWRNRVNDCDVRRKCDSIFSGNLSTFTYTQEFFSTFIQFI